MGTTHPGWFAHWAAALAKRFAYTVPTARHTSLWLHVYTDRLPNGQPYAACNYFDRNRDWGFRASVFPLHPLSLLLELL